MSEELKATITVSVPVELVRAIDERAEEQDWSRSDLVTQILRGEHPPAEY